MNITTRPIGTQAGDRSHQTRNRQSGKRKSNDRQYTSRPESVRIDTDLSQERRREFTVNRNRHRRLRPPEDPALSKKGSCFARTSPFSGRLLVGWIRGSMQSVYIPVWTEKHGEFSECSLTLAPRPFNTFVSFAGTLYRKCVKPWAHSHDRKRN